MKLVLARMWMGFLLCLILTGLAMSPTLLKAVAVCVGLYGTLFLTVKSFIVILDSGKK